MRGMIGGAAAALLCAAGWVATAYFFGIESSWLAILVGVVIGGATKWAGGGSLTDGCAAVVFTVAAVVGGRLVGAELLADKLAGELEVIDASLSEAETAYLADEVAWEMEDAGRTLDWPNPNILPEVEADYPPEVWAEAQRRREMRPDFELPLLGFGNPTRDELRDGILARMFSFGGITAFALAFGAAFKIGAGD
ncbi:MAG: hypothetical protein AAGB51_06540 [Planctomycetota bacterium]